MRERTRERTKHIANSIFAFPKQKCILFDWLFHLIKNVCVYSIIFTIIEQARHDSDPGSETRFLCF